MMKWISTKEKMPEDFTMVLITNGFDVYCGWHDSILNSSFKWSFFDSCQQGLVECNGIREKSVTHWMSLPEPYKG